VKHILLHISGSWLTECDYSYLAVSIFHFFFAHFFFVATLSRDSESQHGCGGEDEAEVKRAASGRETHSKQHFTAPVACSLFQVSCTFFSLMLAKWLYWLSTETRFLTRFLHRYDADNSGTITIEELQKVSWKFSLSKFKIFQRKLFTSLSFRAHRACSKATKLFLTSTKYYKQHQSNRWWLKTWGWTFLSMTSKNCTAVWMTTTMDQLTLWNFSQPFLPWVSVSELSHWNIRASHNTCQTLHTNQMLISLRGCVCMCVWFCVTSC